MYNKTGYRLVKEERLSGARASIYTVALEDGTNLFDQFIEENFEMFEDEILNIFERINSIAHKNGARIHFFKKDEGFDGDGVCALYDDPDKHLRLYCIRYGTELVILGGGGHKPKSIRALQEDPKLTKENYVLRKISQDITQRMREKDIFLDGKDFIGDLQFNNSDDDD